MIYFDNAATSNVRPKSVLSAYDFAVRHLSANPGRSGHKLSVEGEKRIYEARKYLSKSLNNGVIDRLIFTSGCTEALNFAIFGTKITGTEVVTTVTEHNSVLRPLYRLARDKGLKVRFADIDAEKRCVTAKNVLSLVNSNTAFVCMNAVSNVTGYKNEYETVGDALDYKIPFIVDFAQAGGHVSVDMQKHKISALAIAGHKGYYALTGVGVLAFNKIFDLAPTLYGGSGGETFEKVPSCYPEKLEAGTKNLPAILSLFEGAKFADDNMRYHSARLLKLTETLISGLNTINGVKCYSEKNEFGTVAFDTATPSVEFSETLSETFSIATRGGFHCAPLMHESLKTNDNGLIRASLSPFNTDSEVNYFLNTVEYLVKKR